MKNFLDKKQDIDLELDMVVPVNGNSGSKRLKKSASEAALSKLERRDSPLIGRSEAEINYDWVRDKPR